MLLKFIFYSRFFPDTYLTSHCLLSATPSFLIFFLQPSYQFPIVFFCFCEITFPITWAQMRSAFILFSFTTNPTSPKAPD